MDFSFYRYRVNSISITLDKTYELKPEVFLGMTTINAYQRKNSVSINTSDRMPRCIISLGLEGPMIKILYEYEKKGKISLNIAEVEYNGNMIQIGSSGFINNSFDIMPVKSIDNYMIPDGTTELDVDTSMYQLQNVDLYIYQKEVLNYFNQEVSLNLNNISRAGALQALFKYRNIPSGTIIATPPEDNGIIKNLSLPLASLIKNIDYINTYYGLYSCTPLVYWDFLFKTAYCINRYNPNIKITNKSDFDNVTFILSSTSSPQSIQSGSSNSLQDRTHYVPVNNLPTIQNFQKENQYTTMSNIISIDAQNGKVIKKTLNSDSTSNEYILNQNKLSMSQYINDLTIPGFVVALSTTDSSLKIFKPYKTYRFNTDPEYDNMNLKNKKFRIGYFGFELHSNGNNEFVAKCEISLFASE